MTDPFRKTTPAELLARLSTSSSPRATTVDTDRQSDATIVVDEMRHITPPAQRA